MTMAADRLAAPAGLSKARLSDSSALRRSVRAWGEGGQRPGEGSVTETVVQASTDVAGRGYLVAGIHYVEVHTAMQALGAWGKKAHADLQPQVRTDFGSAVVLCCGWQCLRCGGTQHGTLHDTLGVDRGRSIVLRTAMVVQQCGTQALSYHQHASTVTALHFLWLPFYCKHVGILASPRPSAPAPSRCQS